jgi:hypothetical protein
MENILLSMAQLDMNCHDRTNSNPIKINKLTSPGTMRSSPGFSFCPLVGSP